jgi:hypothetical protein
MSLGDPFGSMFAVIPTVCLAALATFLGIVCGMGTLLRRSSRAGKRKVLAAIGLALSIGFPLFLWLAAIVWL